MITVIVFRNHDIDERHLCEDSEPVNEVTCETYPGVQVAVDDVTCETYPGMKVAVDDFTCDTHPGVEISAADDDGVDFHLPQPPDFASFELSLPAVSAQQLLRDSHVDHQTVCDDHEQSQTMVYFTPTCHT